MKKSLTLLNAKHWPVGLVILLLLAFGGWRLWQAASGGGKSLQALGLGNNQQLQLGGQNKDEKVTNLSPLELTAETASLDIASLKAGHHHSVLLTKDGDVYAWGSNTPKSVSGSNVQTFGTPQRVTFAGLNNGERVTQIDTSRDHTIALTSEGRVYTWGSNYTAQLGDGSNTDRGEPKVVGGLPKATFVTAGYRHSAVITEDDEVWGWGGSCTEKALTEAEALVGKMGESISALGAYGSTTQADLTAKDPGECTTQVSTFVQSKTPKKLHFQGSALEMGVTEISAGYGHLLVRTEDGQLFSGGCNSFNQLGREKAKGANDLAKVDLPGPVTRLSAGYRHSVVIMEDQTIMTWGYNGPGSALHVNSREFVIEKPTKLDSGESFADIEAAHDTTFAITEYNRLLGWGQDDAEAFWSMQTSRDLHPLGTLKHTRDAVSGGLQHLLVLEEKRG